MTYSFAWLKQPTTVAGMSALLGASVAVLMHQISAVQMVPVMAGAIGMVLMPDNSAGRAAVHLAVQELVNQIVAADLEKTAPGPAAAIK